MTIKTRTSQQEMYVQPRYMNPRTRPGVVLMQTEDGVVPQGYPATGQQPAYVLLQVTRNKTFYTDTNEMNPSLNKTKFQAKYQMFFFIFSLFVRKQINYYSVQ